MLFARQVRYLALLLYLTAIGAIEFSLYLLIDGRTSPFLRIFVLCEIPLLGTAIFVMFYLMSEFNARSKWLLVELDKCLYAIPWGGKPTGELVKKLLVAEIRHLVATDRLAINMADTFQLVRVEILRTMIGVVNYLLLLINVNR